MQTIKFDYNKRFVYKTIIVWTFLFLTFFYKTFNVKQAGEILFYALLTTFLFIAVLFFIKRHFVRTFKSQIVLELNQDAIMDYGRTRIIRWDEIKNVVPVRQFIFKKYTGIAIDLYDEKHYYDSLTLYKRCKAFITKILYKTPIVIDLNIISYDNEEIVLTFQDYFEKIKECTQTSVLPKESYDDKT